MRSKFQYRFFCSTLTLLTGWIVCAQPAFAQVTTNPHGDCHAVSPLAGYADSIITLNRTSKDGYDVFESSGGQGVLATGFVPDNDNSTGLSSDQQIVLEVRFVSLPADQMKQVRQFLIPGSSQTFGNPLPTALPIATQTAAGDPPSFATAENRNQVTFVSATTSITQTNPTFVGQLDEAGMRSIIQLSKAYPNAGVTQAPTVTIFSGQTAALTERVTRPFVVDVKPVQGDFASSVQPIIQVVDDGTMLRLRGTLENGQIRIEGDLAISEILSAETYKFSNDDDSESNDVSVQVPQHKLKQIHWSTILADGQTIMIDPADQQIQSVERKSQFGLSKKINMRSMYFVTARRVPAE